MEDLLLHISVEAQTTGKVIFDILNWFSVSHQIEWNKCKGKVHPCTGTEALYRPYSPQGE